MFTGRLIPVRQHGLTALLVYLSGAVLVLVAVPVMTIPAGTTFAVLFLAAIFKVLIGMALVPVPFPETVTATVFIAFTAVTVTTFPAIAVITAAFALLAVRSFPAFPASVIVPAAFAVTFSAAFTTAVFTTFTVTIAALPA